MNANLLSVIVQPEVRISAHAVLMHIQAVDFLFCGYPQPNGFIQYCKQDESAYRNICHNRYYSKNLDSEKLQTAHSPIRQYGAFYKHAGEDRPHRAAAAVDSNCTNRIIHLQERPLIPEALRF